jgi:hypothetical protein
MGATAMKRLVSALIIPVELLVQLTVSDVSIYTYRTLMFVSDG